jgi:hypothetical protein
MADELQGEFEREKLDTLRDKSSRCAVGWLKSGLHKPNLATGAAQREDRSETHSRKD